MLYSPGSTNSPASQGTRNSTSSPETWIDRQKTPRGKFSGLIVTGWLNNGFRSSFPTRCARLPERKVTPSGEGMIL